MQCYVAPMGSQNRLDLTHALFVISDGDTPKERNLTQLRGMSEVDLNKYQHAIFEISEVLHSFFVYVDKAMSDLDASLRNVASQARTTPMGNETHRWTVDLEFRILNYCAAVVAYYDRVLAEVKRKQKGTESTSSAPQLFNELFDDSLAYRVVCSLRNALIHGSRNLLGLRMEATLPEGSRNPAEALVSISIPLNKEGFARGSAKALVRNEIRSLDTELDVLELCRQTHAELSVLDGKIIPIMHPNLEEHIRHLSDIIDEVAQHQGYPMVMSYDPDRFKETTSWSLLPHEVYDYVRSQGLLLTP